MITTGGWQEIVATAISQIETPIMKNTHNKCLVGLIRFGLGLALILPIIALLSGCASEQHQTKRAQMMAENGKTMQDKGMMMMDRGMMMRDKGTMMMDMGKMMMMMPDKGKMEMGDKMMMQCSCCQMMMKNMAADTNSMSPGNMSNTNTSAQDAGEKPADAHAEHH
jgi:hypothetical protein